MSLRIGNPSLDPALQLRHQPREIHAQAGIPMPSASPARRCDMYRSNSTVFFIKAHLLLEEACMMPKIS